MKFKAGIIKGFGRGKQLGFPTFNLEIPAGLKAEQGIYAGWVWLGETKYPGAFHFGPVPTFHNPDLSLEVYILDTLPEITVTILEFELLSYLRPIKNFAKVEDLQAQIAEDVRTCQALLK